MRSPIPRSTWTPDHHNITFYYPGGVEGYLVSIKEPRTALYREVKEQFYGSNGVLETTRSNYRWYGRRNAGPLGNGKPAGQDVKDSSLVEDVPSKREITLDAVAAFFTAIVDNKPVNLAQPAVESTLSALLGRAAYETGRVVTWDELAGSDD